MPFAFGHLIGGWIFGKVLEFSGKKKICRWGWIFLLFGAILPDADLVIDWTLNIHLHRTFSHSLSFLILMPLVLYLILRLIKNKKALNYSFFLLSGITVHFILDFVSFPGLPLLWPDNLFFSINFIGYHSTIPSLFQESASSLKIFLQRAIVDMALGTAWIFYLSLRKKIKF